MVHSNPPHNASPQDTRTFTTCMLNPSASLCGPDPNLLWNILPLVVDSVHVNRTTEDKHFILDVLFHLRSMCPRKVKKMRRLIKDYIIILESFESFCVFAISGYCVVDEASTATLLALRWMKICRRVMLDWWKPSICSFAWNTFTQKSTGNVLGEEHPLYPLVAKETGLVRWRQSFGFFSGLGDDDDCWKLVPKLGKTNENVIMINISPAMYLVL